MISIKKIIKEFRYLKNSGYPIKKYTKNFDIEVTFTSSIHNISIKYYLNKFNEMQLNVIIDNESILSSSLFSQGLLEKLKYDIVNSPDFIKLKFYSLFIGKNLINKMEGKIIYSNKGEAKFLFYFISFCLLIPICYILISSLINGSIKSDYIGTVGSIGVFLIFGLFILIIVFFIHRYQIAFDFENQKIIYVGYFTKMNVYDISSVFIQRILRTPSNGYLPDVYNVYLYSNNKKICKLESFDLEYKTKLNIDDLTNYINVNKY